YFTKFYQQNPFFILAIAGLGGYLLPEIWLSRRVAKRQQIIRLALPDALDLLVICVEAGLGLDQSLMRVSQELRVAHPELSEELAAKTTVKMVPALVFFIFPALFVVILGPAVIILYRQFVVPH